jgi:hypothetical protein
MRRPPSRPDSFTWTMPRQIPPWNVPDVVDWTPWEKISLPQMVYSAPAAVSREVGMLDVFARGAKNELLWKSFNGTKWLPDPTTFYHFDEGIVTSAPAAVARPDGLMDVVARGPDNKLYLKQFDGAIWGPFIAIGEYALQAGPGITSTGPYRLDTFHTGARDSLAYVWSDAGLPWAFEELDGKFGDAPAAYAWADGRAEVFVRGADGHLWRQWSDGLRWHGHQLPPKIIASPSVAATRYSVGPYLMRLDCIFRGVDGMLSDYWFESDGAGILDLPALIGIDAPAAVNSGMGRLDVFSLDERGTLLHTWHDPPPIPDPNPSLTMMPPIRRSVRTIAPRRRLTFVPRRRAYATSDASVRLRHA